MNKLHFGGCLDELKNLVDLFKENIDDYKSSRYDEENTKIDFIDKFFKLLGWDMYNYKGYSEDFREVVREDKVIIQGRPKSPDYAFKIGKERQFFVEAKKPSVNIKEGVEPAFQVRRYAYTAGLPVSILTDFEEFSVYDTRIKPNKNDKASAARIFYCTYEEYEKNFDFIVGTFSKEAVLKGKLNIYTRDGKKKKGTQPIDKELLKQIEEWRTTLAKNIALRNKELDIYQLNEAVQKIIDRIIFLRMAEDRNTEVYNTLKTYSEQKNIYEILVKYFTNSNTKYNSGLFAIVDWLDKLIIDDKIFKEIITDLYYPNPYEFSVLPIEILGQIYEQFLGKTIRLTPSHQAKVEEKPEVRKAGGVYYTPKYIVNYIVENTVGKKLGVLGIGDGVLGVGDRGLEENSNIVINERLENENISGTGRLERSDEPGGDDLSEYNSISEGGKIRADELDTEGGGIDTVEHSGRVRQRPSEGISLPSVCSKGFPDGSGDADNNSEPAKLSDKGKYKAALGQNANSRQTSYRPAKISKTTKTQYPKPKTLKILDPACGSGSFLVGAFNYLLNYHLEYYTDEKRKAKALKEGAIYQVDENTFRLTIREKRKILLNNIYGVDIDLQAVEVTKLSLLLKLMEGEIVESRGELFLKSISEALLPDLKDNIKCGNSLIGSDFYHEKDMQLFDMHEQRKINCFDWEVEFPQVFGDRVSGLGDRVSGLGDQGLVDSKTQIPKPKTPDKGFDCVIGNPPYLKERGNKEIFENVNNSKLGKLYHKGKMDYWYYFVHKGITLLKENGYLSYITNSYWMNSDGAKILIKHIESELIFNTIVYFDNYKIFDGVSGKHNISIFQKSKNKNQKCNLLIIKKDLKDNVNLGTDLKKEVINNKNLFTLDNKINILVNSIIFSNSESLEAHFDVSQGVVEASDKISKKQYANSKNKNINIGNGIFVLNKKELENLNLNKYESNSLKPYLNTNNVKRYAIDFNNEYLIYSDKTIKEKISTNELPNLKIHLDSVKEFITSSNKPYGLHRPRQNKYFEEDKLICKGMFLKPEFTFDNKKFYCGFSFSVIIQKSNTFDLKYLLALLNSSAGSYWFNKNGKRRGIGVDIGVKLFRKFPIPKLDLTNSYKKAQHDRMVNLVEQMLDAQKEAHSGKSKTETDKKLLQQRIDIIDKQIDRLVYELYELTEEEIGIIEEV